MTGRSVFTDHAERRRPDSGHPAGPVVDCLLVYRSIRKYHTLRYGPRRGRIRVVSVMFRRVKLQCTN